MTRDEEVGVIKAGLDVLSLTTLGGWLIGALPAIATLLTVIWTVLRIAETRQVQRWLGNEESTPPPPSQFDSTD